MPMKFVLLTTALALLAASPATALTIDFEEFGHGDIVESPNFQTRPIEASYIAVAHTDCEADLRNLAGFSPVAEYGSRTPVAAEEIGSVEDVRYVLSPELTASCNKPFYNIGEETQYNPRKRKKV